MATERPEKLGDFRILDVLGRGGMGVVYRGVHESRETTVAIKTVGRVHAEMLHGIRREILALRRLEHPGVVKIVAEGVQEGMPWYAMEFCHGRTLRAWVVGERPPESTARLDDVDSDAGTVPFDGGSPRRRRQRRAAGAVPTLPPSPRVLTVLRQLCEALAYIHGEGVVHRDLKPDNVIVGDGDGDAVLVDFGLAVSFAARDRRERLDAWDGIAGTTAYMSPEQAAGEPVDARADLYSLGCLVYEVACGRPPFLGTFDELLHAHRSVAPVPLRELVPAIPPLLDEMVLHLLAKDPRDRLGHAGTVAKVLESLGATPPRSPRAARSYLYRSSLVGRSGVLEEVRRILEERASRAFTIRGESGSGKTRLLMAVARMARERGYQVLSVDCPPEDKGRAAGLVGALLSVIEDRCRQEGASETQSLLGGRGRILAAIAPTLLQLPEVASSPPLAVLPADEARERLLRALLETIRRMATMRPLAIVLDDLQWAGDLTIGLVELLVRTSPSGVLTVLACRSDEDPALPSLSGVQVIDVDRLSATAVESMVAEMLASRSLPAALVEGLVAHGEGNPFFVAEYLKLALDTGLLRRGPRGDWEVTTLLHEAAVAELRMPRSVQELVQHRLGGLGTDAHGIVAAASVLGREVSATALAALTDLDEPALVAGTLELVSRQILQERQVGSYEFVHDKLREGMLASLHPAERSALHLRAARSAEALGLSAAARAHHLESAGLAAEARDAYMQAARDAQATSALRDSVRHLRKVLALSPALDEVRTLARIELGFVLDLLGHSAEASAEVRGALADARELHLETVEASASTVLSTMEFVSGNAEASAELLDRAAGIYRSQGDRLAEARVLDNRAGHLFQLGRPGEAVEQAERSLALFREAGDRDSQGVALVNLGGARMVLGQLDEAVACLEEGVALLRAGSSYHQRADGEVSLAVGLARRGELERARGILESALAEAQEIGLPRRQAAIELNLGVCLADMDRLAEAEAHLRTALPIMREIRDARGEAYALRNIANVLLRTGRVAEAREPAAAGVAILRAFGDRRAALEHEALHAECLSVLGETAEAEAMLRRGIEELETLDAPVELMAALAKLGHLRLHLGGDPGEELARVEALEASIPSPPSLVTSLATSLRAAVAARAGGRALVWGYDPATLPEGTILPQAPPPG